MSMFQVAPAWSGWTCCWTHSPWLQQELVEGICILTWLPPDTNRSVGRTGNVQLPSALLAVRSREEAL